jgi:hypothetical protein
VIFIGHVAVNVANAEFIFAAFGLGKTLFVGVPAGSKLQTENH